MFWAVIGFGQSNYGNFQPTASNNVSIGSPISSSTSLYVNASFQHGAEIRATGFATRALKLYTNGYGSASLNAIADYSYSLAGLFEGKTWFTDRVAIGTTPLQTASHEQLAIRNGMLTTSGIGNGISLNGSYYGSTPNDFGTQRYGLFMGDGYKNNDEGWRTVMSYPWTSRVFSNQQWMTIGDCACDRLEIHSTPLRISAGISSFDPSHTSANSTINSTEPLGEKDFAFCINKIAKEYSDHINHEITVFDKLNTMIRTDGINGQIIPNMPIILPFDEDILYADLIAINNITFSNVSRITAGYERQIRAGKAIDINSNGDNNFEFDAQKGSKVDILITEFAEEPEDCQPLTYGEDKNNTIRSNHEKQKNDIIEKNFINVTPNPVRSNASIQYGLGVKSNVNLWITNYKGQTVKIIHQNLLLENGKYQHDINTNHLNNGIYFIHLTTNGKKITTQMIVTK